MRTGNYQAFGAVTGHQTRKQTRNVNRQRLVAREKTIAWKGCAQRINRTKPELAKPPIAPGGKCVPPRKVLSSLKSMTGSK